MRVTTCPKGQGSEGRATQLTLDSINCGGGKAGSSVARGWYDTRNPYPSKKKPMIGRMSSEEGGHCEWLSSLGGRHRTA